MKSLYETILDNTHAGLFKFTPDMLNRLDSSMYSLKTQFKINKIEKLTGEKFEGDGNNLIWALLMAVDTKRTKNEVHNIFYSENKIKQDTFFKDILKEYLINPDKFDFKIGLQFGGKTFCVYTAQNYGSYAMRDLFTLDATKI